MCLSKGLAVKLSQLLKYLLKNLNCFAFLFLFLQIFITKCRNQFNGLGNKHCNTAFIIVSFAFFRSRLQ